MPLPPPRVTVISGTEAPSSLNSTTATSTAATGRWTSTSQPNPKMPKPYVVKFWPETWASNPHYWHFYEREEVEQSTYDQVAPSAPVASLPAPAPAPAPE